MSYRRILADIRKADTDYELIADGDRICVGVSGGKDSILLLKALDTYRRVKEHYDHASFTITGIHIDMGFPGSDMSETARFAEENDIPFVCYKTDLYDTLLHYPEKDGSLSCSRCSILRKGALKRAAREYGCGKIAYAHHAEDAAETLLMNMIYGSRIAVFAPKLDKEEDGICFIRPLVYVHEDDIERAVREELRLPAAPSRCPNEGITARQRVKELLLQIHEQFPESRTNLLRALSNPGRISLWNPKKQ